ncbi:MULTISPECIES: tyrosine-type recombinase/integrase [Flavobacterium]|uniref:Integrase n=2 Tax=Flavobacterium TaxID=237 RepID=A0AA94F2N8_9FLAO|nr:MULTISPECIES: tyrosine-type recombinase/integrase [Flavobacterium]MCH4828202.1 tyrosine-type recombinase/integrase [Flavobacterium columnare]MCH4828259.1 tyrosine-type recombinase/integrase [Flavobacterium columnare]MCH4828463.1 tyrosine-type recombinase/integrase [Flavobacterium columnare]MCH4829765.1 tyrosine-type recombinase/integrase [Flavobacterium columnare]MCH4831195.1 tyrosine-type recombinase/integrase [Flavobacterium columnare]
MTINEYLEKKYSKSTLYSNLFLIKRFTDYYGNKAKLATFKDVLNYIEHLRKNYDLSPKTLRHCLYGVKIYFNYLLETGQRKDHPCSELFLKDKIDRQIQVDTFYSPETLEKFFETYQIRKKKYLENRNKVIISLLIYQALTVKEIAELEVENINLEKCEIYIKGSLEITSKSPQSRTLPLNAKQILLIYNYLEKDRIKLLKYNNKQESSIFILGQYGEKINAHGISKMINEQKPKQEQIQPMKIRQSVIANLLKKENDTRIVQVFSGHRRASTTIQYKQTELEQLQNAVNNYHPIR